MNLIKGYITDDDDERDLAIHEETAMPIKVRTDKNMDGVANDILKRYAVEDRDYAEQFLTVYDEAIAEAYQNIQDFLVNFNNAINEQEANLNREPGKILMVNTMKKIRASCEKTMIEARHMHELPPEFINRVREVYTGKDQIRYPVKRFYVRTIGVRKSLRRLDINAIGGMESLRHISKFLSRCVDVLIINEAFVDMHT